MKRTTKRKKAREVRGLIWHADWHIRHKASWLSVQPMRAYDPRMWVEVLVREVRRKGGGR